MRALLWLRLIQLARHIPNFLRLFWRLLWDRRVSLLAKSLLLVIPIYLVTPLEVLTNAFNAVLPGLGWVDDAVVSYLILRAFIALCPPMVVAEHVARIEAGNHREIR